jgi:mono/diheme cytochrome c family protein
MKKTLFLILSTLTILSTAIHAQSIDSAALYQDYCSVCHGDKGDGNSHARQGMNPPPRDFTSPLSALELNQQRISHAIREGIPGTAMSGWKPRLSEPQITALTDYIRTRFMLLAKVETTTPGSRIYADYCSVCHGESGKGAVWATAGLSPAPVDFTSVKIQASLSRKHMVDAVTYGRPETAMTGWKSRLSDDQITTVVDYVINVFMPDSAMAEALKTPTKTGASNAHAHHVHTHADMKAAFPNDLQGNLAPGRIMYADNCATCHGVKGDGRGPRAYFINPKPRDFLHTKSRASLNRPALFDAISKGRLRTEMPAWGKVLNDQQIADIGEYVLHTFINP